jgi:hypothetical protein
VFRKVAGPCFRRLLECTAFAPNSVQAVPHVSTASLETRCVGRASAGCDD